MGTPFLEGSLQGRASKSAFRLAVSFSELSVCPLLKPGEQQGSCPVGDAEDPVFPLWTRAVFASSEEPSVKEYVTCT